jgi:hypothetical protein
VRICESDLERGGGTAPDKGEGTLLGGGSGGIPDIHNLFRITYLKILVRLETILTFMLSLM